MLNRLVFIVCALHEPIPVVTVQRAGNDFSKKRRLVGQNFGHNRKKIKTEEKAKVVAAAWLIQFFVAQAILHQDCLENDELHHQDDTKNRMNSTRTI